jgi:hypothetical protein
LKFFVKAAAADDDDAIFDDVDAGTMYSTDHISFLISCKIQKEQGLR